MKKKLIYAIILLFAFQQPQCQAATWYERIVLGATALKNTISNKVSQFMQHHPIICSCTFGALGTLLGIFCWAKHKSNTQPPKSEDTPHIKKFDHQTPSFSKTLEILTKQTPKSKSIPTGKKDEASNSSLQYDIEQVEVLPQTNNYCGYHSAHNALLLYNQFTQSQNSGEFFEPQNNSLVQDQPHFNAQLSEWKKKVIIPMRAKSTLKESIRNMLMQRLIQQKNPLYQGYKKEAGNIAAGIAEHAVEHILNNHGESYRLTKKIFVKHIESIEELQKINPLLTQPETITKYFKLPDDDKAIVVEIDNNKIKQILGEKYPNPNHDYIDGDEIKILIDHEDSGRPEENKAGNNIYRLDDAQQIVFQDLSALQNPGIHFFIIGTMKQKKENNKPCDHWFVLAVHTMKENDTLKRKYFVMDSLNNMGRTNDDNVKYVIRYIKEHPNQSPNQPSQIAQPHSESETTQKQQIISMPSSEAVQNTLNLFEKSEYKKDFSTVFHHGYHFVLSDLFQGHDIINQSEISVTNPKRKRPRINLMPQDSNFPTIMSILLNQIKRNKELQPLIANVKFLSSEISDIPDKSKKQSRTGQLLPRIVIYPDADEQKSKTLLEQMQATFKNQPGIVTALKHNTKHTDLIYFDNGGSEKQPKMQQSNDMCILS